LTRELVARTGRTVGELRGNGQLTPAADLHSRNAFLPACDQAGQGECDGLAAVPRRVELLARVELDTDVVDLDLGAGLGLRSVTDHQVLDDQLGGGGTLLEFDFRLAHALSPRRDRSTVPDLGRSASFETRVVALGVTRVDLARTADLQRRVGVHLTPVR